MRIAAEAAFRKAVKLAPGYSVAHYNLAVFYATANTPSPELAKWHYQKARAAGHPKSDELENMLASR
jgi:Tfp pilus assembly protein PilF